MEALMVLAVIGLGKYFGLHCSRDAQAIAAITKVAEINKIILFEETDA